MGRFMGTFSKEIHENALVGAQANKPNYEHGRMNIQAFLH